MRQAAVTQRSRPAVDRESFEAVYAAHHDFVWRCLRAMGVSAAAVDDATQDVFVIVHRRLPAFDYRAPVRAWVFGIARNIARKHHDRSRRPRPQLQLVHGAAPQTPDEAFALREAASVVEQFLATLDEGKRAVFVAAQLEGQPVPEIAAALKIKLNTAYSRLRAARREFERIVARHEAMRRRSHAGT